MSNTICFSTHEKWRSARIADEIALEKTVAGIYLDEKAREFIAACVMSCATNSEYDSGKIKQQVLSHAALL